jgi:predicted HAD superfamily phosphohydrolase
MDSAENLMRLFPNGEKVLAVLSRYSELLTRDKKEGFEAGDVLTLIVPFLILHDIQEDNIGELAVKSTLTEGASNLVSQLEYTSWKIFCLASAYEQYTLHITQKLGIYAHHVACTALSLNEISKAVSRNDLAPVFQAEKDILTLTPGTDDLRLKQRLDVFYNEQLLQTRLASYLNSIKPVAGKGKLDALNKFVTEFQQPLSKWVLIGSDSPDSVVLQAVEDDKGLAVAFNADEEALLHSTLALASTSISDLIDVLLNWQKGGRNSVERLVKEKEKTGGKGDRSYFNWLSGKPDISGISQIHQRIKQVIKDKSEKVL